MVLEISSLVSEFQLSVKMIENYPDDKPFPSGLFYGIWQNQPLHAVIASDLTEQKIFLITAYWPDEEHFETDLKTRRR